MKKIAIFASGSGSNAENIVKFFKDRSNVEIPCVLTNNPKAFVIERLKGYGIDVFVFDREMFYKSNKVLDFLKINKIDFIVLAGFLWLVPKNILKLFPGKIVNIHPALLPKFGGKGMYGMKVHEAVIAEKESETGITIHYVNENYDEGDSIFQAKCAVLPSDDAEMVANKVHELEYKYFPSVIDEIINTI